MPCPWVVLCVSCPDGDRYICDLRSLASDLGPCQARETWVNLVVPGLITAFLEDGDRDRSSVDDRNRQPLVTADGSLVGGSVPVLCDRTVRRTLDSYQVHHGPESLSVRDCIAEAKPPVSGSSLVVQDSGRDHSPCPPNGAPWAWSVGNPGHADQVVNPGHPQRWPAWVDGAIRMADRKNDV